MKLYLVKFLTWLVMKLDGDFKVTRQLIGTGTLSIDWKKYVPPDGKWHSLCINFSCYMLGCEPSKKKDVTTSVCIDGASVSEVMV